MNSLYKDPNPNHAPELMRQYQFFDNVLKIREAFIREGFWDQYTIERFAALFQQFIDIIRYDHDPMSFSILFKIKKTTVKKMPNYRAEAMFYYNAVGNAMAILLKENKDRVIRCLANYFAGNPNINIYDIYFNIINNALYTYNLTNVQCISDNIVQVIF